jgi:cell division protein ZapE
MTPLDYYLQKCQEGVIFDDPEQKPALNALQCLYDALIIENQRRKSFFSFLRKPRLVQGLYLWGGVGIGKTFLMDCFYHTLPIPKLRMHFYQFMQRIHSGLTQLQGHKDPLQIIAKQLAEKTQVLCFDEFFVTDITDAMILGRLLKALFATGVCLVTTSNMKPDDLYKNGLQREQFIPAIELIKKNTEVIYITTKIDYRLRHLKEAGVFYTPLDDVAKQKMEKSFTIMAEGEAIDSRPLEICGREITVIRRSKTVAWFDFNVICSIPRSQQDYLAIAKEFKTIFISDIPLIASQDRDRICLFISLVDVFYDARVRLVISAAEPVENIYNRGHMVLEYTRTHSRLIEMQSTDYFASEFNHR